MFVPAYDESQAREAVSISLSYAEALRKLGLSPAGGNHRVLRRYVDEVWKISTDHFDPRQAQRNGLQTKPLPMNEVLVEDSSYGRASLKRRLFQTGLKAPVCELCGQGEIWRGHRMSMIIDHINGIPNDNRLENLQIVCPNCAATLDTHCGRKNKRPPKLIACARCGEAFAPSRSRQRYCSRKCGCRHDNHHRGPTSFSRKVEWPPYEQLIQETQALGFSAVGRKYGVSDGAVRKWIRWYEATAARSGEGRREAA